MLRQKAPLASKVKMVPVLPLSQPSKTRICVICGCRKTKPEFRHLPWSLGLVDISCQRTSRIETQCNGVNQVHGSIAPLSDASGFVIRNPRAAYSPVGGTGGLTVHRLRLVTLSDECLQRLW